MMTDWEFEQCVKRLRASSFALHYTGKTAVERGKFVEAMSTKSELPYYVEILRRAEKELTIAWEHLSRCSEYRFFHGPHADWEAISDENCRLTLAREMITEFLDACEGRIKELEASKELVSA